MSEEFVAVHVGARAGSGGFPQSTRLNDSIRYIAFEADEACIEQIVQKTTGLNIQVLPYCIAQKTGKLDFNINSNPFASSILPFNQEFSNYFHHEYEEFDSSLEEMYRVEKQIQVDSFSLDDLIEKKAIPGIDFLSLDTEGSEYQCLKGAQNAITNQIVGVQVEVNFVELFKGGNRFVDIDKFLTGKGLFLAQLETFDSILSRRIPAKFRARKIPLQGEALYFLNPDYVESQAPEIFVHKLEKLAFSLIVFGYIDIAYQALERIISKGYDFNQKLSYQQFLNEFYRRIRDDGSPLPELWHEKYSSAEIKSQSLAERVDIEYTRKNRFQKSTFLIRNDPKLFLKRVFALTKKYILDFKSRLPIEVQVQKRPSDFGLFLKKYGLDVAAKHLGK